MRKYRRDRELKIGRDVELVRVNIVERFELVGIGKEPRREGVREPEGMTLSRGRSRDSGDVRKVEADPAVDGDGEHVGVGVGQHGDQGKRR